MLVSKKADGFGTMIRFLKYWWQRRVRGFDERELWNLDQTLTLWLLPRLRAFSRNPSGHPYGFESMEDWQATLGEIIWALEKHSDYNFISASDEEAKRVEAGMELFGKYWRALWD